MFKKRFNKDVQFVEEMQELLKQQPARKPTAVNEGKARFLAQASMMRKLPVTHALPQRHTKWKLSRLKELKMGTLITLIVILGLALGGTSAVYAAQDDLPGDPLYQVKLLSEGARLDLTTDPEKKMDLDLKFALRRLDEIEAMIASGKEPPEMSYVRMENHLMRAIGQASFLDNDKIEGALLKIRETLQARVRTEDLELETPIQTQLRNELQERVNWLDSGMDDPERFANETRIGWETAPNQGETFGPRTGVKGDEDLPGNKAQPTDDPGMGPGNETPGEGSGNGNNGNKP